MAADDGDVDVLGVLPLVGRQEGVMVGLRLGLAYPNPNPNPNPHPNPNLNPDPNPDPDLVGRQEGVRTAHVERRHAAQLG